MVMPTDKAGQEAGVAAGAHELVSRDNGRGSSRNDRPTITDIEEFVRIRLQHSPYRAIRRVGCTFSAGELTLNGTVPTYHYKQLAQTAVTGIAGVERIINAIDVG